MKVRMYVQIRDSHDNLTAGWISGFDGPRRISSPLGFGESGIRFDALCSDVTQALVFDVNKHKKAVQEYVDHGWTVSLSTAGLLSKGGI